MSDLEIAVSFAKGTASGVELRWYHITKEELPPFESLHGGGLADHGSEDGAKLYESRRNIGVWRMAPGRHSHSRAIVPLHPGHNELKLETTLVPSGYRLVVSRLDTDEHGAEVGRTVLFEKAFQFDGVNDEQPGPFEYLHRCPFSGDFVARAEL